MFRLSLLVVLFVGSGVVAAPPNVVLILADDLGGRDLGCYGSTYHRTPHLDAFAKQGMRFTAAYSASPVCSPTRAALMTGKHPARLGITDWLPGRGMRSIDRTIGPSLPDHLPADVPTLAERLKKAGYATGHIGKGHLGGVGHGPSDRGFDVNVAGDHTGTPMSYFSPFAKGKNRMPGLEDAPVGEYLTDRLAVEAVKFVAANKDRPFFLYLPHYAVHTPMAAPKDRIAKYQPGKPGQQGNPTYAAMVESLDTAVGAVLTALDEHKLAENTWVIFTSDNGGEAVHGGPATYNGPLREGKGYLYEGGLRVPLLVRGPGVTVGVSDTPVSAVDLCQTILDIVGHPTGGDGVSLRQLLTGGTIAREALFWHYPHTSNQGGRPGGAVRAGSLKLIEFYDTGRRELFDLAKDPSESRNLSADRPLDVVRLAKLLADWRQSVGAKMPTPNPGYTPNPQAADGTITLHSRTGTVTGVQLRYEPLPHKNTLGFWGRKEDTAEWEFTVTKPGTFAVSVLQGCGKGSGGAEVELAVGDSRTRFTVKDTGGFQAFEKRDVGTLTVSKPGRHTLTVTPRTKPGPAVMDLREVILTPTGG